MKDSQNTLRARPVPEQGGDESMPGSPSSAADRKPEDLSFMKAPPAAPDDAPPERKQRNKPQAPAQQPLAQPLEFPRPGRIILTAIFGLAAAILGITILDNGVNPALPVYAGGTFAVCLLASDWIFRRVWQKQVEKRLSDLGKTCRTLTEDIKRIDAAEKAETPAPAKPSTAQPAKPKTEPIQDASPPMDLGAPLAAKTVKGRSYSYAALIRDAEPVSELVDEHEEENEPSDGLSDLVVNEMMHEAIRTETLDVFAQPVAKLPTRQPAFFEMYARIRARPGLYLPATRFLRMAEQDNLLEAIDKLTMIKTIEHLRKNAEMEGAPGFFVNICPNSLSDASFVNQLLSFLSHNKELAARLIFELPQKSLGHMPDKSAAILKNLHRLGCRFSLDHVMNPGINAQVLKDFGICFIKIPTQAMTRESASGGGIRRLMKFKSRMSEGGVTIIAEKMETEKDLRDLLDLDLNFAQGRLFGRPDFCGAYLRDKASAPHAYRRGRAAA